MTLVKGQELCFPAPTLFAKELTLIGTFSGVNTAHVFTPLPRVLSIDM